jgi:hypothetical protein
MSAWCVTSVWVNVVSSVVMIMVSLALVMEK